MKLWVFSDLHVSHSSVPLEVPPKADVALVAGDVGDGFEASLEFLHRSFAGRIPVLWTLGNHEHFGEELPRVRSAPHKSACVAAGIYLLDDQIIEIGGTRFLGSTLWTDFDLFAKGDPQKRQVSMHAAAALPDYREIWLAPPKTDMLARHFTPSAALARHQSSLAWLFAELHRPFNGPSVVITHHAPHPFSVNKPYEYHPVTPAYVSDLSSLIEEFGPNLWLHGHTHSSFDYTVVRRDGREVRIVCNPRGFVGYENPRFDPRLLIDLS